MQRTPQRAPPRRAPRAGALETAAGILRARAGEKLALAEDYEEAGRSWLRYAAECDQETRPRRRAKGGGGRH